MALMDKIRHLPVRVVTGAYILHAGIDKLQADDDTSKGLHGMASAAFPQLERVPPDRFVRGLAVGEIAVGSALLAPVVPATLAGGALTAFSGALVALYARTPRLRRPGSIWPSPDGMAISKDAWMLGIGASLMAGGLANRRAKRRAERD